MNPIQYTWMMKTFGAYTPVHYRNTRAGGQGGGKHTKLLTLQEEDRPSYTEGGREGLKGGRR